MDTTLVVLAAGIGSRYKAGIKQLAKMDKNAYTIIDYSIFDAIEAGFNKVVFIIRKDIEKDFKEVIGSRIEKFIKTKDDTQKDGAAKDKVPQKATINERMEQQKKEEEEMQQIMDLYREWFQKNEITEEEVQEWKRGVSNRKETME